MVWARPAQVGYSSTWSRRALGAFREAAAATADGPNDVAVRPVLEAWRDAGEVRLSVARSG